MTTPDLLVEPAPGLIARIGQHGPYLAACRWPVNWDVAGQLQLMWARGGQCWYLADDLYWGLRPMRPRGDVAQLVVLAGGERRANADEAHSAVLCVLALAFGAWAFRKCEWWLADDAAALPEVAAATGFEREATFDGAIQRAEGRVGLTVWSSFRPDRGALP